MKRNNDSTESFIRTPSAWLPVGMSLAALVLVISYLSIFGITQQEDEGVAAHIFQLLLVVQIPVISFFIIKWFPKRPMQTLQVLTVQFIAGLMALAPVFFLEL